MSLIVRTFAVAALVGAAAVGSAATAAADSDDHHCFVEPWLADCEGGAFGLPSGPDDAGCAMDPADAVCGGGAMPPGAGGPSTISPPIGSDLPGSLNPDGTPFGSEPIGGTGMIGGTPGMPGSI